MKKELHERKWEIDSLCYPVRLSYHYWKETGDASPFGEKWQKAAKLIVQTFKEQQRKDGKGPYSFMRVTERAPDTVPVRLWESGEAERVDMFNLQAIGRCHHFSFSDSFQLFCPGFAQAVGR